MPSTEPTTLSRIQQEIQDVLEREKELKNLNNLNGHNNNNADDEDNDEEQKSTLVRIQEEIENVMARERELKKPKNGFSIISQIDSNDNEDDAEDLNGDHSSNHSLASTSDSASKSDEVDHQNHAGSAEEGVGVPHRVTLLRAKSTSVLVETTAPAIKPHFRRLISANPNKGVMQRFLKSRGKLQGLQALTSLTSFTQKSTFAQPTTNGFAQQSLQSIDSYELSAPKVNQGQGQYLRKNFVPTEKKIQQDIEATYKREAELKTLRQSQGNLAVLDDTDLDAPLGGYGLRASKSMAALYNSDENFDDALPLGSAPASLKPARSLAQLCDAKDEEVTSPQALITHFQQMIIKNQESNRT